MMVEKGVIRRSRQSPASANLVNNAVPSGTSGPSQSTSRDSASKRNGNARMNTIRNAYLEPLQANEYEYSLLLVTYDLVI